jgi:peptide methionine sulfoxide reductase MsrB
MNLVDNMASYEMASNICQAHTGHVIDMTFEPSTLEVNSIL